MASVDFADLNGHRIISGSITIPYYGTWSGDVVLALSDQLTNPAVVTFADITLTGAIWRQFAFTSSRSARLVGGAGGWSQPVPAIAYNNPGGVAMSMVLGDVAALVGETIKIAQDAVVGPTFVREAAPAARTLRQLAGINWWVDPSGITQIGPRTNLTPITTDFQATEYSGGKGQFKIATEHPADWMPGRTFSNEVVTTTQTIDTVTHTFTNDGQHRLEVLASPTTVSGDRMLANLRQIIRAEFPQLTYGAIYEYAIQAVAADGSTADAVPTSTALPLPQQIKIPLRSGLLGEAVVAKIGVRCRVVFINADPTRPAVIGADGPPGTSTIDATQTMNIAPSATAVVIGAGSAYAARVGDTVVAGGFTGTITTGSTKTKIG